MNTDNKPEKRGKWWVRLCIDLKHLRLKKECLKVAEHALLEQSWVKSGDKSALFRIKDQLVKFMSNKQPTKKRKKAKVNESDEEIEEEQKIIQDIIKDVALTQNTYMLT